MGKKIKNGQVVDTASDGTIYATSTNLITADASVIFTQTYSTAALTVPTVTYTAPAVTAVAAPAGGTGATAGGWDTAANRDLAIASITATETDLLATNVSLAALAADNLVNRKLINSIIDAMQANGLAG
jgi:hypothetical protein